MQSAWIRGLPVAALLSLLPAGEARAAGCHPVTTSVGQILSPCIDADNLWPHAGGGPYFVIGSTTTTAPGSLSFGIVGSFLTQPVGLRVASADPSGSSVLSVDNAFDATLLVALGVTDRLELTLAAPATLYQSGAGLGAAGVTSPLLRSAPRDLRFGFSLAMLRRPRTGEERGPALTGRLEFATPTGSETAFASGRTAVIAPALTFSYRIGRVDVSAEAVARLRGEATFATAVVGPQVGGALGASVDILKERWLSAGAELFALYTTSKQLPDPRDTTGSTPPPLVPGEWIAHVSTAHFFGGDLTLSLGGGSSVPFAAHGAFTSPRYRLDFALRYAPTGRDTDGDGVLDRDDRCPTQPGPRASGGCPEAPAASSESPPPDDMKPAAEPPAPGPVVARDAGGPAAGVADTARDAIPDASLRWEGDRVVAVAPVRFAPGRAEPPAALVEQLQRMARLARELTRGRAPLAAVVLETYADRQGDTSVRALELAAARAEAVKKIFVAAGVPVGMITAAAGDPMAERAPDAPAVDVTLPRRTGRKPPPGGATTDPALHPPVQPEATPLQKSPR